MSVRVQIAAAVKTDKLAELLPFLKENLPKVRAFDGCLSVTVLLNREIGSMVIQEEWLSADQHQQYLAFIESNGVLASLAAHFKDAPDIQYFDRVHI